ncbi:metalloregulator ArsR/SmtB family transcription factor [Nocardia testacea]|uniref:Metalloregulator ArsR/SmtB family transcription factor n=1 Tax=Nocardia testacea TaxID=248551 RepID=A0ABW7W0H6_9NOCA
MDEVAAAVADPVRREILEMLRGSRHTAGAIAARFPISRPAISRHLRVLRNSGLVRDELVGRQRYYALDTAPLRELRTWLAALDEQAAWEHRLDALATEVHRTRRERRATAARPHPGPPPPGAPETSDNEENSA